MVSHTSLPPRTGGLRELKVPGKSCRAACSITKDTAKIQSKQKPRGSVKKEAWECYTQVGEMWVEITKHSKGEGGVGQRGKELGCSAEGENKWGKNTQGPQNKGDCSNLDLNGLGEVSQAWG